MKLVKFERFSREAIIPLHHHPKSKVNLLLSGELIEFTHDAQGRLLCHHRKAPCFWRVPANRSHSVRVVNTARLLSLSLPSEKTTFPRTLPTAAVLLALSLSSAQACDFTEEDLNRIVDSEERPEVPDCFFDNLAAAASGGDPQAQLDLGIVTVEGLDHRRESSASEGFYWIKRAIYAGHPTAEYVLKGYQDELLC